MVPHEGPPQLLLPGHLIFPFEVNIFEESLPVGLPVSFLPVHLLQLPVIGVLLQSFFVGFYVFFRNNLVQITDCYVDNFGGNLGYDTVVHINSEEQRVITKSIAIS